MKVEYNSSMEILTIVLGIFTISFAIAYAVSVSRIKKMTEAFAQVLISQAQLEAAYENYAKAKSVVVVVVVVVVVLSVVIVCVCVIS